MSRPTPPAAALEALAARLDGPSPDPARRALALLHATLTVGLDEAALAILAWTRAHAIPEEQLEEAALQVAVFGGYPRAIQGLGLVARGRRGAPRSRADDASTTSAARAAAGRETWRRVYAEASEDVLAVLDGLVPGLAGWVLEDAYGRVLAREGLPLVVRELLAVAALALLALPSPLAAHARGALRNGAGAAGIEDILATCRLLAEERPRTVIDQALDRLHRNVYAP